MVEKNKRVIIVGIPGIGKTTVVSKIKDTIESKTNFTIYIAEFGKIMLQESSKLNIGGRDEIRKLSLKKQRELQNIAAQKIAELSYDIVVIDTHLFISTKEGYYPGLPKTLLDILQPTNLVLLVAKPHEVYFRRKNDQTRDRDIISVESIQNDLEVSRMMVSTCSVLSGAPFMILENNDDQVNDCTEKLFYLLTSSLETK
ncbi:MAG: adenylate kinase [Nitrososphaeraceae archaeon]